MLNRTFRGAALGAAIAIAASAFGAAVPANAQVTVSEADEIRAGELAVPVNKSQVLRSDRPFTKALIGNPEIADRSAGKGTADCPMFVGRAPKPR